MLNSSNWSIKTCQDCQPVLLLQVPSSHPQIHQFLNMLIKNMLKTIYWKSEICSLHRNISKQLTEKRKKILLETLFISILKSLWVSIKLQKLLAWWLICLRLSWIIQSFNGMSLSKRLCLLEIRKIKKRCCNKRSKNKIKNQWINKLSFYIFFYFLYLPFSIYDFYCLI